MRILFTPSKHKETSKEWAQNNILQSYFPLFEVILQVVPITFSIIHIISVQFYLFDVWDRCC